MPSEASPSRNQCATLHKCAASASNEVGEIKVHDMNIDWIGAQVKRLLHGARVKVQEQKIG